MLFQIQNSAKMKCDRFVGTGLVEVVKPNTRIRRSSSDYGRYFSCKRAKKNCQPNQKYFSMRVKAKRDMAIYPNVTKNTNIYVPDDNLVNENEDNSKIEDTIVVAPREVIDVTTDVANVIVPTALMCQSNDGNKLQSLIQDKSSRRRSLNAFKTDIVVNELDKISHRKTTVMVIFIHRR